MSKAQVLKELDKAISLLQKFREDVVSERDTRRIKHYEIFFRVSSPCEVQFFKTSPNK